jgi:hypothetical protein
VANCRASKLEVTGPTLALFARTPLVDRRLGHSTVGAPAALRDAHSRRTVGPRLRRPGRRHVVRPAPGRVSRNGCGPHPVIQGRTGRPTPPPDQRRLRHSSRRPRVRLPIADEPREQGIAAGENGVAHLCSQQRTGLVFAKKPGLTGKVGPPVHDDLVDRKLTATAPNVTWLTDITEHRPPRASSTSARSRTSTPAESSATPSTRG